MAFAFQAGLLGVLLLGSAGWLGLALPRRPEWSTRLPRERWLGGGLGALCLLWAARLTDPLLEGGLAGLRPLLLPLALILTVAAVWQLDYLFTRALCGLVLLGSTHLLHAAFTAHASWRPAFSAVCYLLGLLAIYTIAYPFRFRDYLEACSRAPQPRRWGVGLLGAAGLLVLGIAVASHGI